MGPSKATSQPLATQLAIWLQTKFPTPSVCSQQQSVTFRLTVEQTKDLIICGQQAKTKAQHQQPKSESSDSLPISIPSTTGHEGGIALPSRLPLSHHHRRTAEAGLYNIPTPSNATESLSCSPRGSTPDTAASLHSQATGL